MSDDQLINFRTEDEQDFEMEYEIAKLSVTLKNLIEEVYSESECIPVPNVTGKSFEKIIEWGKYYTTPEEDKDEDTWNKTFFNMETPALFELILAANFLDIPDMLDVLCKQVANMIKGKEPDEIRTLFNIENDFTKEEEEEIRKNNEMFTC